ncbi:unnamed protein product [Closterium sp. Naga37s-1]|nr:unnamed protein product [Closterium sp. Naga37s-1]
MQDGERTAVGLKNSPRLPPSSSFPARRSLQALRKRQVESFNQQEEVARQLRIQAERDEVARIGWKRAAKKLLGRLRGSQWDPLPGADVDFADFWALLQMGRVKFVNYGDNGRFVEGGLGGRLNFGLDGRIEDSGFLGAAADGEGEDSPPPTLPRTLGLEVKRGDVGGKKGGAAMSVWQASRIESIPCLPVFPPLSPHPPVILPHPPCQGPWAGGEAGRWCEEEGVLPHPAKDLGLEVKRGDGARRKRCDSPASCQGPGAGGLKGVVGRKGWWGGADGEEAGEEAGAVGHMGLPDQVVWLKHRVVWLKHRVRHMPADVHSELWSLLRTQLAHVTLTNRPSAFPPAPFTTPSTLSSSTTAAPTALPSPSSSSSLFPSLLPASSAGLLGSTVGTMQLAATWGLRLALACGLYVGLERVLFPLYQPTKLEERPRSSHRKLTAVLNPDLGTMGQSRARYISAEEKTGITFDDFAGQDYVKRELQEVVRILRAAKEFEDLGVYCPKGVLLFGPPGTGKTLLAKAIAGEAGVPFFSVSGAEFVEMFAGVAASRVKDLFFRARQFAPAIIFIDEIDAIGSKRGTASDQGGGNIEREQGLIQILTELDGFQENQAKVLVIGATNRLDMLDPALLRKGRFDKVVRVGLPTEEGRFSVLKVHARSKAFKSEEEKLKLLREIAAATPDYSGAELMNILNEAAILAIRKDKDEIEREELLQAIDRQAGEFKTGEEDVLDSREVRMRAAYREASIAVLECALPDSSGPIKRTSLDNVDPLPNMEHERVRHRCFAVKQDMLDAIVRAFAPAIMERMVFGAANVSWQAGVAYREAVQLADYVILRSGMSALGKVVYETQKDLMPHLIPKVIALREEYMRYSKAKCEAVLKEYRSAVDTIAERLLEEGEVTGDTIHSIYDAAPKFPQHVYGGAFTAPPSPGESPSSRATPATPPLEPLFPPFLILPSPTRPFQFPHSPCFRDLSPPPLPHTNTNQPPVRPIDEYAVLVHTGRWGIHGASLPGRATFHPGNSGYANFGAPLFPPILPSCSPCPLHSLLRPIDEYAVLVHTGRWGIHGASLPGRATFHPGNSGYATFGAPRPQQVQAEGRVVEGMWRERIAELRQMDEEDEEEREQQLLLPDLMDEEDEEQREQQLLLPDLVL